MSILRRLMLEQRPSQNDTRAEEGPGILAKGGPEKAPTRPPRKTPRKTPVSQKKTPASQNGTSAAPRKVRGRLTRPKTVSCNLTVEEYDAITAEAQRRGIGRGALMRRASFGDFKVRRPHPEDAQVEVNVAGLGAAEIPIDRRTAPFREKKPRKAKKERAKRKNTPP